MNQAKFELFSQAYRAALVIAINEHPEKYCFSSTTPLDIPKHAQRILDEMFRNPKGVLYTGGAFKLVCKTLGIKHTRKAIFEYLEIQA